MVWEETWGVHSKLTLSMAFTLSNSFQHVHFQNKIEILRICVSFHVIFNLTLLYFFVSWREVIFCQKNGEKGSPTQGSIPNVVTGTISKTKISIFNKTI